MCVWRGSNPSPLLRAFAVLAQGIPFSGSLPSWISSTHSCLGTSGSPLSWFSIRVAALGKGRATVGGHPCVGVSLASYALLLVFSSHSSGGYLCICPDSASPSVRVEGVVLGSPHLLGLGGLGVALVPLFCPLRPHRTRLSPSCS